jgi:ankyrin repeat protein
VDCGIDINSKDDGSDTPLSHAAPLTLPAIVKMLFEKGADTSSRN